MVKGRALAMLQCINSVSSNPVEGEQQIRQLKNLIRAIKRFALFDLLKSLYSETKILSKYIPSLQKRL